MNKTLYTSVHSTSDERIQLNVFLNALSEIRKLDLDMYDILDVDNNIVSSDKMLSDCDFDVGQKLVITLKQKSVYLKGLSGAFCSVDIIYNITFGDTVIAKSAITVNSSERLSTSMSSIFLNYGIFPSEYKVYLIKGKSRANVTDVKSRVSAILKKYDIPNINLHFIKKGDKEDMVVGGIFTLHE